MSYIRWKVESVDIERPDFRTLPVMEVSLSGVITNYGAYKSRRMDEVINEVENRLNLDIADLTRNLERSVYDPMEIKNVIFNPPATIVFWADGTKTVVKVQEGEDFDPEKGLAMAISKKALGNQGNYYNQFKKWTEKYEGEPYVDGHKVYFPSSRSFAAFLEDVVKKVYGDGKGSDD